MKQKTKPPRRTERPAAAVALNHPRAAMLDRQADAELQHGHTGAAGRFAWHAALLGEAEQ